MNRRRPQHAPPGDPAPGAPDAPRQVLQGQAAQEMLRRMRVPEPNDATKAIMQFHYARAWAQYGPGTLYVIWGQLDREGRDAIRYVTRPLLEELGIDPALIDATEAQWTQIDPTTAFVLMMVFPHLGHFCAVRTYTGTPPPLTTHTV